jgi:hypothetical protein
MKIIFVGNFQQGPGGEAADETHLVRELELAGHEVAKISRDEWREYVEEGFPQDKYNVPEVWRKFDIAIVCKWHHFYDGKFMKALKQLYSCPVFYWVWDNMEGHTVDDWHIKMAKEADLYLSGELGLASHYKANGIRFYYFQFDSVDGQFPPMHSSTKEYDVIFTGSHTNQNGRLNLLKEINKEIPIQVFAHDYEEWQKDGFAAKPAVYGQEFNKVISQSKIVLGTSAGPDIFGYWSNRVGKVLWAGGFLLQWYTPGMESIIGDACQYFSTAKEAIEKIKFYLPRPDEREKTWEKILMSGPRRWTSEYKVSQLTILIERYLNDFKGEAWILP